MNEHSSTSTLVRSPALGLLDGSDVLVVDPFNRELRLLFPDGWEVAEEIVDGVAVAKVAE